MSRRNLINRRIFDLALMRPLGCWIYEARRSRQVPAQSTATKFFRNLEQLSVFESPLRQYVEQSSIRVLVAGCSMGCEAYTIAAYLAQSFPSLDWSIDASDISEEALAVARSGRYGREHGLGGPLSDTAATLEKRLFLRDGGCWNVREDIRSRISFKRADVLSEEFSARTGYDAVFGQNFMIHMSAKDEARAFSNLVAVLRDGGVLFAGGMDLDRRIALACSHGLRSVNWRVSAIHDADDMRRSAWPWFYWSLEPINNNSVQSLERYATVYVKHRDD